MLTCSGVRSLKSAVGTNKSSLECGLSAVRVCKSMSLKVSRKRKKARLLGPLLKIYDALLTKRMAATLGDDATRVFC